jgi:hypothetical protein
MKRAYYILALLCVLMASCGKRSNEFAPQLFSSDWRFALGDTTAWQRVDLPHDWSVKGTLDSTNASCMGYLPTGVGWYRKTFDLPEADSGKRFYLYFEGVYNRSTVWINGHELGSRPNGYVSFQYDLTPHIQLGKSNVITVRADHSRNADSRWYTGSGIYRNVWLLRKNALHIALWGTYAYPSEIKAEQGLMSIETEVENSSDAEATLSVWNEIVAPDGKTFRAESRATIAANSSQKVAATISVTQPALWSLDQPTLYTLRTKIACGDETQDEQTTRTAFRSFSFDPDKGFALNGKPTKLKGVCLHHDAGVLGAAVPRELWRQRIAELKGLGCNAIRTSHNPQSPDFYDLCDELGMLVLDEAFDEWEFAKRKWIKGWNKGVPGFDGSFDFFAEWGERDLADMVRRDRNHPCIFAWSIGNEVDYPNDPYSHPILNGNGKDFTQPIFGGYKKDAPDAMRLGDIAKRLVAVVKHYDTSRPVTAGLAGVAMSNETGYPDALDVAGYNYTESRYDSDHEKYPTRPIYGSENRHDYSAWKATRDREHIFGQFLWTGIDYLGESHAYPSRGFDSGLLDLAGFVKPQGWFRKSLWTSEPMIYIGTVAFGRRRTSGVMPVWSYEAGDTVSVICFTNAPQARLVLNGNALGEAKPFDDKRGSIMWRIPFAAGELEAIALDSIGNETARYAIKTCGDAYALSTLAEGDETLTAIAITAVDKSSIPVFSASNEITCTVSGAAQLLGLENGNSSDMGDHSDNVCALHNGRLKAYVQRTGKGKVTVRFQGNGLKEATVNF